MAPALTRRRGRWLAAVVLSGLAITQSSAQPAPVSLLLQSGSAEFTASATLGDFTGTTTVVSGQVSSTAGPEQARGWVIVRVDSLSTGNGRRDGHMRDALEAEAFPEARFDLDSIRDDRPADRLASQPPAERDEPQKVRLFGRFTVHGVVRPVVATGTLRRAPDDRWTLAAEFPVTLADHQISKGLSRMFGTIKVGPVVDVRISATFSPR